MDKTADRLELHVDQFGQILLPKQIQEQLKPGVVLAVESRANGTVVLRLQQIQPVLAPHLIDKAGVLVVRGEVSESFNWDTASPDEREAPLHTFQLTA